MKKLPFKAFTLVEMLIVIVIIGILIAALLPRLQGAQGMARDTARKTALSNIQAAIVAYQGQMGRWPLSDNSSAKQSTGTSALVSLLDMGLITDIPVDNNLDNEWYGLGQQMGGAGGEFLYMITTKNSNIKGGFVLMAKTETPGSSNWVVESGATHKANEVYKGWIGEEYDIRNLQVCKSVRIVAGNTNSNVNNGGECIAADTSELRYVVAY